MSYEEEEFERINNMSDRAMLLEILKTVSKKDEITKLKKLIPVWVSVDERLPNEFENVLVCCNVYGVKVDCLNRNFNWAKKLQFIHPKVTHWMPLPPAPCEVAK